MRKRFSEDLLALFTARENAVAIIGDLTELSLGRGRFAREVIRVAVAFCFRSLLARPGRALCFAGLGLGVYVGVYIVLFVASGLPWYPWHRVNEPDFWVRVCLVVFASNLVTGGILGQRVAPAGNQAIASLTALWLLVWFVWPPMAWLFSWPPFPRPWTILLAAVAFPLFYLLPFLVGAVVAQRRIAPVIQR